jgi:hypothetical protein
MRFFVSTVSVFIGLVTLFSVQVYAFTDTANHLNEEAIEYLADKGVVVGYSDGTYGSDEPINRAEFLKILLVSTGIQLNGYANCFPDVKEAWYSDYVCTAKGLMIIDGYPDGYFRPANDINLAEALKMILEAYDADINYSYERWYEPYFWFAKPNGILEKVRDDVGISVSRGEMAQLIYNLDDYYFDLDPPPAPDPDPTPDPDPDPDPDPEVVGCYISDSLKSYKFDTPSNIYGYSIFVDDISTEGECRDYAIDHYETNAKMTRSSMVEGDIVNLANNITVQVEKVEIRMGRILNLTASHFIDGIPLDLDSDTSIMELETDNHFTWNETHGYRVELISLEENNDFVVEFTPLTPYLSNPADLYNDCYLLLGSTDRCYQYSLFEPLPGEIEIETDNFFIIGLEKNEDFLEGLGDQLEICYAADVDFMGIETSFRDIPVHVLEGDTSGVAVMGGFGIKLPYFGDGTNDYEGVTDCINNVMSHELSHAVVFAAPISEILNEGLATFVAHQVIDSSNFSCEEDGYNRYGEFSSFGDMNLYSQIPYSEGGSELYFTSACFWDEYYNDFGVNNFLDTMDLLDANRNFTSSGSTIDLIEGGLGIDLSDYMDKYGFNYTTAEYPLEDIAERYVIFGGSTGTRWDGNY